MDADRDSVATHRALQDAGARWRAGQPPPPALDVPDMLSAASRAGGRRGSLVAVAAGLAVAAVGTALVLARHGGVEPAGPPTPPTPQVTGAAMVRAGDQVRGFGVVLGVPGRDTVLCQVIDAPPTGTPRCDGPSVPLDNVDLDALPGRQHRGSVVFSGDVSVRGRYVPTGRVQVATVRPARPDELATRTVPAPPCSPPSGGWRHGSLPAGATGPGSPAETFVRAHADTYSGVWLSFPSLPRQATPDVVAVVGTTGDPDQARRDFAHFFPHNLCVQRVRHARSELDSVIAALHAGVPGLDATVDTVHDRVQVNLAVYGPAADRAIRALRPERVALVEVVALLEPAH